MALVLPPEPDSDAFRVLAAVRDAPGMIVSALAEYTDLSRGGVSRILSRLEEAGLVEEIEAFDRRARAWRTTRKGAKWAREHA